MQQIVLNVSFCLLQAQRNKQFLMAKISFSRPRLRCIQFVGIIGHLLEASPLVLRYLRPNCKPQSIGPNYKGQPRIPDQHDRPLGELSLQSGESRFLGIAPPKGLLLLGQLGQRTGDFGEALHNSPIEVGQPDKTGLRSPL